MSSILIIASGCEPQNCLPEEIGKLPIIGFFDGNCRICDIDLIAFVPYNRKRGGRI